MSLYDFCGVCKVPFEGNIEEPHRSDVDGFIDMIVVGETRKVSDARITSIHFPVLCYLVVQTLGCARRSLPYRSTSDPLVRTKMKMMNNTRDTMFILVWATVVV